MPASCLLLPPPPSFLPGNAPALSLYPFLSFVPFFSPSYAAAGDFPSGRSVSDKSSNASSTRERRTNQRGARGMERTPLAAAYPRWRRSDTSEGRDWPATRFSKRARRDGISLSVETSSFLNELLLLLLFSRRWRENSSSSPPWRTIDR